MLKFVQFILLLQVLSCSSWVNKIQRNLLEEDKPAAEVMKETQTIDSADFNDALKSKKSFDIQKMTLKEQVQSWNELIASKQNFNNDEFLKHIQAFELSSSAQIRVRSRYQQAQILNSLNESEKAHKMYQAILKDDYFSSYWVEALKELILLADGSEKKYYQEFYNSNLQGW